MTRRISLPERLRELAATDAGSTAIVDADGAVTAWAELDALVDEVAAADGGLSANQIDAFEAPASVETIAHLIGVLRAGRIAAPIPAGLTPPERSSAMGVIRGATPPDGTTLIVLTSGTTDRPKGVCHSAASLDASARSWMCALPAATGWVLALGLGHVAGLGVVWRALLDGVPIRIAPANDSAAILEALRDAATSHISLVPTQLARLLDLTRDGPPPPSLRAVLTGGGIVPESLVRRAFAAGWPVVPTYGLSEMGSGVTALTGADVAAAPGSAGRRLPEVRVAIDEADAAGVGEIVVAGPSAFLGYLGEATRAADAPFRTGDLGRLDAEGRLYVIDRRTDRIVRGGDNVAPAEVEAVLLAHPAVADAGVVARRDDRLGQVPVAAIVLRPGEADPGDEALAGHCRSRLAGFKVPSAFVRLDVLPRGASGKLRRPALRALIDGEPTGQLERPGGDRIGWRITGSGARSLVLLHGTLSTAEQLDLLAGQLASSCGATVHALDRRGSGSGRLADPRPLDMQVHVEDVVAYLDARGIERCDLVGISFGGVVALETAARRPGRVRSVAAYEPPYFAVADDRTTAVLPDVVGRLEAAYLTGGAAGVAETFLRAVAGDAAWERLSDRSRAFLVDQGGGALADGTLEGLRPDSLASIAVPVLVLDGGASEPFYAPLADELARRIPGARRDTLGGLAHPAPINRPGRVAEAIRAFLETVPA